MWLSVMHEHARKRVKAYIATVREDLKARVHGQVQVQFPEIHLQAFSQVVSDGFRLAPERHHPPPQSFEDNISTLLEMNLAVRVRAIQVLEAVGNNLHDAVTLLLAAAEIPFHPNFTPRPLPGEGGAREQ